MRVGVLVLPLLLAVSGCRTPELDMSCLEQVPEEPVAPDLASREAVLARLRSVPRSNADRGARLEQLLREVGCAVERPATGSLRIKNVLCTLAGTRRETILVGAHFDRTGSGDGIIDNWSGAVLLPPLYAGLSRSPVDHTYVFAGFSSEELGLLGSRALRRAWQRSGRLDDVIAVVNLDTLGLGPTRAEAKVSSDPLLCSLQAASTLAELPLELADLYPTHSSDFQPFLRAGLPVIAIHSLGRRTANLIHTRRDRLEALDPDHYYDSYRLVAVYLSLLDRTLSPP